MLAHALALALIIGQQQQQQPLGFVHNFDDAALPTPQVEDLIRFHDATLALQHGATAAKIDLLIRDLERRWWDTAGFDQEYRLELRWLRWASACWKQLEQAGRYYYDQEEELRQLRRLLGPSAYYAGRMPDFPSEAFCPRPIIWEIPN